MAPVSSLAPTYYEMTRVVVVSVYAEAFGSDLAAPAVDFCLKALAAYDTDTHTLCIRRHSGRL